MARAPLLRRLPRPIAALGVVHEDRADPATAGADRPWKRLAWFAALWAASVAALGVVGYAIKLALGQ
ncbi:hypothetical protein CKO28_07005 [Rhodovibrio sodomensis]|uniref:DUF2474 domain-containing protein n=1 Tax=Rhodovibrio sodomensis TaxID=1088 RepID=A0ABS1DCV7_9PROT|nr:hypothetical protein [Rhodovibrio sodomensis]